MEKHITSVGALFIGFGVQGVFLALCVLGATLLGAPLFGNDKAASLTMIIGLSIGIPVLLTEALRIAGGVGLLRGRRWARPLCLVIGFLSLLNIPIGAAYGMYAIWVLMKEDSVRLLAMASGEFS